MKFKTLRSTEAILEALEGKIITGVECVVTNEVKSVSFYLTGRDEQDGNKFQFSSAYNLECLAEAEPEPITIYEVRYGIVGARHQKRNLSTKALADTFVAQLKALPDGLLVQPPVLTEVVWTKAYPPTFSDDQVESKNTDDDDEVVF